MENRFELTDEIMEKAETYMPVLLKETISADVARVCVREAQLIRKAPDEGEEPEEVTSYGLSLIHIWRRRRPHLVMNTRSIRRN